MSTIRSLSRGAHLAPRAASCSRGRGAARRKMARFQPRAPEDFFSPEAWRLLSTELTRRARDWQVAGLPCLFYYGGDSEPVWGDGAHYRCSGTTLHIARQSVLREGMGIDLERALRLLVTRWGPDGMTADGRESGEWRAALASVFWRVGQHFREFQRRKGAGALDVLREEIERLPISGRAVRMRFTRA